MTTRLSLVASLFALLGVATGIVVVHSTAVNLVYVLTWQEASSATALLSQFSALQFNHADLDHARSAALLQLEVLQGFERVAADPGVKRNLQADIAYTHARLGMIDEAVGQVDSAKAEFEEAQRSFSILFPHPDKELTPALIKKAVELRDQALY